MEFRKELDCQTLIEFNKPIKKLELPSQYNVDYSRIEIRPQMYSEIRTEEFAWSLSGMNFKNLTNYVEKSKNEQLVMPGISAFNSLLMSELRGQGRVLPILPHPVTNWSTVYTQMCNFKRASNYLKQDKIPVFCDRGVYEIAKSIQLLTESEFGRILLLLGYFHLTKTFMACCGKYITGSGIEEVFVEK